MDNETLLFLHVPKCGGTTMQGIIDRYFPPETICEFDTMLEFPTDISQLRESLKGIRLIRGHIQVGLTRYLEQSVLMTVLRDPVQRLVSLYYYMRNIYAISPNQKALPLSFHVAAQVNLRKFVCHEAMGFINHNGMCTFLTDDQWNLESLTPEEKLKRAKQVVDRCAFVGITERMTESIDLMCWKFNWKHPKRYESLNIGNRVQLDAIDPDIVAQIRINNKLDYELYQYARARFERDLNEMDIDCEHRLEDKEYAKVL